MRNPQSTSPFSIARAAIAACLAATLFSAAADAAVTTAAATRTPAASPRVAVPPMLSAAKPFIGMAVSNADATRPGEAMRDSGAQISALRAYLPTSVADAPLAEYAQQYQMLTEQDALRAYRRERGDRLAKIQEGDPADKKVALTFDDGPHGPATLQLLSILKAIRAPATFFVVGKQAIKYPAVVQLEVIDGNEVGNHTFDHVNLTKIPARQVPYEIDACDSVLHHIIGTSPRFFRPPGGQYNAAVVRAAAAHGYITTLWTDDPGDYKGLPASEIYQRLLTHLHPGGIVLLHDGMPQTMDVLPTFVAAARRQGYQFVTMSALAAERGAVP